MVVVGMGVVELAGPVCVESRGDVLVDGSGLLGEVVVWQRGKEGLEIACAKESLVEVVVLTGRGALAGVLPPLKLCLLGMVKAPGSSSSV